MARFVRVRPNPTNPELFGEDIGPLAIQGLGVGLSAWTNSVLVFPLASRVIHPGDPQGLLAKLFDAATTAVSAYAVGLAGEMLDTSVGRHLRRGGLMLAVVKAIGSVVPGFSLQGSVPFLPPTLPIPGLQQPAPALPGGSSPAPVTNGAVPADIGI